MTEDDLLRAAETLGLPLTRVRIGDLLSEVERIRDAARRLRELPLDLEASPFAPDADERR
ncbi:MAG: hypothetical protein A2V59_11210 [Armatimonadetes bacterium RBG_19FT_COMBO_69_19]|nr:MAG: hypothetical protein A2V59_11210 [Armatimonadetes bacterium RBG_19FT_COMBO_69_19]